MPVTERILPSANHLAWSDPILPWATHAFLEDFRDISVGETGQVDAGSGFVDFRNTASVGIVLPSGFSLDGPDAPPTEIITTVPLPPAAWLFLSGLVGLVSVAKRRR